MNEKVELILQHGWGFSADCWDAWRDLAGDEMQLRVADRGYFGGERKINSFEQPGGKHALVAHSLGLHLLPGQLLNQTDLLVIISGFRHFHGSEARGKEISARAVRRMISKCSRAPQVVLSDFYKQCYSPAASPDFQGKFIDRQRLLDDLELLDHNVIDMAFLETVPKVLVLHGACDEIVPLRAGEELCLSLANCRMAINTEAGHALPFTNADWCWQNICANLGRATKHAVPQRDAIHYEYR